MGVSAAVGLGSALLNKRASDKAADAQMAAGRMSAQAAKEAAERSKEAAKFRAIGITSPYATPSFDVNDEGQLQSVSTELDPRLQGYFDRFAQAGTGALDTAMTNLQDPRYANLSNQLFGLGQQQLGAVQLDPMQAAAERTARLQELQAPQRAAQQEQLFSDLASRGLTGLAVDTGTGQQVNPYMQALAGQQAQQDRAIAAESLDRARQDIGTDLQRATGLFGAAQDTEGYQAGRTAQQLQPFQTLFGQEQGIYGVGQAETNRALQLANQERQAALSAALGQNELLQNAANYSAQGSLNAAQTRMAGTQGLAAGLGGLNFGDGLFNNPGTNPTTGLANYSAPSLSSLTSRVSVPQGI